MLKKIIVAIIIVSLCLAFIPVLENDAAERDNRGVQLTVDMDEVRRLALAEGRSTEELLREFKEMGVTAVAIRESPLARYRFEGKLSFVAGYDLLASYKLHGNLHPDLLHLLKNNRIDSFKVYIFSSDRELIARMEKIISTKLNIPLTSYRGDEFEILEVAILSAGRDLQDIAGLRVGVMREDAELASKLGLAVVARPDNKHILTAEAVETVLEELFSLAGANVFIFEGEEATGYPHHLEVTARKIREKGLTMGVVEYTNRQLGQFQVAHLSEAPTLLVHSTILSQDPRAIFNGVRQRRVRLIYLRFTDAAGTLWPPDKARQLVSGVVSQLKRYGFEAQTAEPIPSRERGRRFFAPLLLGLAGALSLLAERLLSLKDRQTGVLFVLFYLGSMAILAFFPRDTALQLLAVLAAITFPSLAVISQQLRSIPPRVNRPVLAAASTMAKTTLISIAGGVLVLALLSNPFFVGGLSLYRGVKIVHTVPLLFIGIWAIAAVVYRQEHWTVEGAVKTLRQLWREPVLTGGLVGLFVLLLAAYFYVGRTGHEMGLYVPPLEVKLRLMLDEFFLVRPRFKEFLVGYPLAWAGLYLLYRGHRSLLSAGLITAGAIAQVSLVNTFSHFTSPFLISLIRTFNGFWLGSLTGLILILIMMAAEKIYLRSNLATKLGDNREP